MTCLVHQVRYPECVEPAGCWRCNDAACPAEVRLCSGDVLFSVAPPGRWDRLNRRRPEGTESWRRFTQTLLQPAAERKDSATSAALSHTVSAVWRPGRVSSQPEQSPFSHRGRRPSGLALRNRRWQEEKKEEDGGKRKGEERGCVGPILLQNTF